MCMYLFFGDMPPKETHCEWNLFLCYRFGKVNILKRINPYVSMVIFQCNVSYESSSKSYH